MNADRYMVIPADLDDYYKSEIEKDLEAFIAEMGESIQSATMSIYRVPLNPRTGLPVKRHTPFLFAITPGELTFGQLCERVRDEYGSGTYKIMIRDEQNVLRKNRNFSVEAPDKGENQMNSPGSGLLSEMTNALQAHSEQLQTMYAAQQKPSMFENPLVLTTCITAVAGIIEKIFDNNKTDKPEKSVLETITETLMTRKAFQELLESEGASGDANIWSAVTELSKSLGPPLLAAAAQAQEAGAMSPTGALKPPVLESPPVEQPTDTPKEPETEKVNQLQQLTQQIEFLVANAEENVPVDRVIDFIINTLPDDQDEFDAAADKLEMFLSNQAAVDQCAMINPKVNEHRDWFETFRLKALEKLGGTGWRQRRRRGLDIG